MRVPTDTWKRNNKLPKAQAWTDPKTPRGLRVWQLHPTLSAEGRKGAAGSRVSEGNPT